MAFITLPIVPVIPVVVNKSFAIRTFKSNLKNRGDKAFAGVVESTIDGWEKVWEGKSGLTPEEALECLGTDAVQSFQDHAKTVAWILSIDSTALAEKYQTVGAAITAHDDGTISLTAGV